MLRLYEMPNGHIYQFEESEAPDGAVPVAEKVEEKAKKATANKARKAETK